MKNPVLTPDANTALETRDFQALRDICINIHPASAAGILIDLEPEEIWRVLADIELERQAEIFSHLDEGLQREIAISLQHRELVKLVTNMSHDDRVDFLKQLPEETSDTIMPALAAAEREDIRRLSAYKEGTAGSIMTSEYVSLPPNITAGDAIAKLRREAPNKETIYNAYVVDNERKLTGFITLKDLILARPQQLIEDIMSREMIFIGAYDDQEEAARIIAKYDRISVPVVTEENVLVGIITHDDALDVLDQEHTEDMEKFMAISGKHEDIAYLRTPVLTHFRNRVYWVMILAGLGIFSGIVIHRFEDTLSALMILALYMPMLADTGGNTGSQAATVIIRAIALGEVTTKDFFRVIWKELRISLLISGILGSLAFARVMFLSRHTDIPAGHNLVSIGMVIGLALGIQVISSTLIGAFLPLGASKLKLDPAVVASPAITTIVDITGLLIYFTTAKTFLGV